MVERVLAREPFWWVIGGQQGGVNRGGKLGSHGLKWNFDSTGVKWVKWGMN